MAERLLRRGSRGEDVRQLQLDLRNAGFDPIQIDGIFGPNTDAAVREFQASRGLDVDGIVGPLTRAALAQPVPPPPPPPPPTRFVRRSAWSLQSEANPFDPITLAYARAVQAMQARPITDPTSWAFQAAIHGTFRTVPAGVPWNECQHGGWFFLPWHRMYVFFFERIVRVAALAAGGPADFAIPYWNYDEAPPANSLPPAFRAGTLPDGTPNPLFVAPPLRSAGISGGGGLRQPEQTSPARALALRTFTATIGPSFGGGAVGPRQFSGSTGSLEGAPHNPVHTAIGGPLGDESCDQALMSHPFCAALDPIFWLHHANIDRVWNRWLALGDGRTNPSVAGWLSQTFAFHDETGSRVTLSVADVLDSAAQLSYVYDDLPVISVPAVGVPPQPEQPPELVAATDQALELAGPPASVELSLPPSAAPRLEGVTASAESRVFVNVEEIQAERDPGITYAAYLNLPGDADDAARERHWIGTIGFFGIEAMNDPDQPHDGAPGMRQSFDVTDVVERLQQEGVWDPATVTVSFRPLTSPPTGDEPTAEAEVEVPPVRIGRVSIFVS